MADVGQVDVQAIVDDLRATVEQTYRGPTDVAKMVKAFETTGKTTFCRSVSRQAQTCKTERRIDRHTDGQSDKLMIGRAGAWVAEEKD